MQTKQAVLQQAVLGSQVDLHRPLTTPTRLVKAFHHHNRIKDLEDTQISSAKCRADSHLSMVASADLADTKAAASHIRRVAMEEAMALGSEATTSKAMATEVAGEATTRAIKSNRVDMNRAKGMGTARP